MAAEIEYRQAQAAPPWWLLAAALLVAAYVFVVVVLVGLDGGDPWGEAKPPIAIAGSAFVLLRGGGYAEGKALRIEQSDPSGVAIALAQPQPFAAGAYPRIELHLHPLGPQRPTLALLWHNTEQPSQTFSLPLDWSGDAVAPVRMVGAEGWTGSIVGVAVAVREPLSAPLRLDSLSLAGESFGSLVAEIGKQWSRFYPFRGNSITFPFDEERNDDLPLPIVSALALGLASLGYWVLARNRRWRFDARVPLMLFLGAWLLLDLRWQINLGRQLVVTAHDFAGESLEEKHATDDDHLLYSFIKDVKSRLPPPPARIFFFADSDAMFNRGSFFLYPYNVFHPLLANSAAPDPGEMRAGEYVVLFLFSGLRYDHAAKALVWPDGRSRATDELLYRDDGPALLRLR